MKQTFRNLAVGLCLGLMAGTPSMVKVTAVTGVTAAVVVSHDMVFNEALARSRSSSFRSSSRSFSMPSSRSVRSSRSASRPSTSSSRLRVFKPRSNPSVGKVTHNPRSGSLRAAGNTQRQASSTSASQQARARLQQTRRPASAPPSTATQRQQNAKVFTASASARMKDPKFRPTRHTANRLVNRPTFRNVSTMKPATISSHRTKFYGNGYKTPTVVVNNFGTRYGSYDTRFLYRTIDHDPDWFYHNMHRASVASFWAQMVAMSATNAAMAQQVAAINANSARLKAAKTEVNDEYMTAGVDPSVQFAPEAIAAAQDIAKLPKGDYCSGGPNGMYNVTGNLAAQMVTTAVLSNKNTGGSWFNLTNAGLNCDIFPAQRDAYALYGPGMAANGAAPVDLYAIGSLYNETVHVLVSTASGIEKLSEIDPDKHKVTTVLEGSGNQITWTNFVAAYDALEGTKVVKFPSTNVAVNAVMSNEVQVMILVTAQGSKTMRTVNDLAGKSPGKIRLAEIIEPSFGKGALKEILAVKDDSGQPYYSEYCIPAGTYPNIQWGTWSSAMCTVNVPASLYVTKEWATKNPKATDQLAAAVAQMKPRIQNIMNAKGSKG